MELALEGRIDTDLERLVVADATPLDDDLLDPALADIAAGPDSRSADFWLARTATRGEAIRELALARLVEAEILEADAGGVFLSRFVRRSRRYPSRDGQYLEEVRLRIMRVLFSEEIPGPQAERAAGRDAGRARNGLRPRRPAEVALRVLLVGVLQGRQCLLPGRRDGRPGSRVASPLPGEGGGMARSPPRRQRRPGRDLPGDGQRGHRPAVSGIRAGPSAREERTPRTRTVRDRGGR